MALARQEHLPITTFIMPGAPFSLIVGQTPSAGRLSRQRAGMRWGALLIAAVLLAACGREAPETPAVPEGPPPSPALWRVADADTTVYLFGTIHLLPPGLDWRSDAVDRAFAASDTVMFEADVEGDVAGQQAIVARLGRLQPPQRLSDMLTPDQTADVIAAGASVGVPPAALESLRPWLAAVILADAAIRKAGYSAGDGADTRLRARARESGKAIGFLETVERQLGALAGLSDDAQAAYLMFTAGDLGDAKASLDAGIAAWRAGDTDQLERILITDDLARLPELGDALLTKRNAEWAVVLDRLLAEEPGTVFVAVGAAHLVGDDSVQRHLEVLGHTAERVKSDLP